MNSSNSMGKPLFIFLTTLVCIIAVAAAKGCTFSKGWTINVINNINNNDKVQVHCKSKDNDIGMKSLGFHESINWEFCENIVGPSTLYFCHFYKGNQQLVFDVFNHSMRPLCHEPDAIPNSKYSRLFTLYSSNPNSQIRWSHSAHSRRFSSGNSHTTVGLNHTQLGHSQRQLISARRFSHCHNHTTFLLFGPRMCSL
ncbi:hypothetical protein R6Q59_028009 [Mikania micrantha]